MYLITLCYVWDCFDKAGSPVGALVLPYHMSTVHTDCHASAHAQQKKIADLLAYKSYLFFLLKKPNIMKSALHLGSQSYNLSH